MLRLFGYAGALILLNLLLALVTGSLLFRLATIFTGLGVIGLYLFLLRSRPPLSGTLTLSGLRAPVEVNRDERGVPHIAARCLHDLYMAQGYITAQDRFWQMEINRRTAAGRLAEILGECCLERDRHLRSLGLYRAAEASLPLYSAESLAHLEAYAAGVNAFLEQGRLPPEFSYLRLTPEPWRVADSLAVGKLLAYEFSNTWTDELFRAQLTQRVGGDKAAALFGDSPDPESLQALTEMGLPYLADLHRVDTAQPQTISGSSGWVISGARTQSGLPLLGSGLQAAPRLPSPLYPCHLTGPDRFDVAGASVPGIPAILVGQTRDFAWSFARLNADTQDLVLERPDPSTHRLFAFQGGWEPARRLTEEIRIRGRQEPVTHEVLITRHGPILAADGASAIALRSTVLQPSAELEAFLLLSQAHTYPQFRAAIRRVATPALVALFAGRDGTIAQAVAGAIPIRQGGSMEQGGSAGQVPSPGWTGRHEWVGFIPAEELPEQVNPPEGLLVAAGQSLSPPGYPHAICSPWADPYLAQRLSERLRASNQWTRERIETVLTETVDLQARELIQILLGQVQEGLRQGPQPENLSDLEKRALLLLSGWNHDEAPASAAALLWHQWYLFLVESIFRPQMGLGLYDQFIATRYALPLADRLLLQVATGQESPWLTPEGEQGLPRIALRSFRRAVALLAAKYGNRPEHWAWGREHRVRFTHALSQTSRALAHLLDLGPYPIGGSRSTIARSFGDPLEPFAVSTTVAYHRIVDLGVSDEVVEITAPGVSGHPVSPFFTDQLPLWLRGEFTIQPLRQAEIRKLPRLLLTPPDAK